MLTLSLRRKTFSLLFVASLSMPWAVSAAPNRQAERPQAVGAVEPAALDLLSRIWSRFRSIGNKIGCHIDPDGHCAPAPTQNPPVQPKIGCHIDPSGRCLP
ncbi:MAG TPA: hypothetical protein VKK31_08780 [Thermoanaerobaculia bacterium]|nr:hypothetical protein [Thermoanaerobaculia bacterium]